MAPTARCSTCSTRTGLGNEQAEALIRAGALEEFGLPASRTALATWLAHHPLTVREPAPRSLQPSLPLPTEQDMAELPRLTPWQDTRLGLRAHRRKLSPSDGPGSPAPSRGTDHQPAPWRDSQPQPPAPGDEGCDGRDGRHPAAALDRQRRHVHAARRRIRPGERRHLHGAPGAAARTCASHVIRRRRGRVDNENSGFPNIIAERFRALPVARPDRSTNGPQLRLRQPQTMQRSEILLFARLTKIRSSPISSRRSKLTRSPRR